MVEERHSTIIIVPHAHGKVYKLRLSPRTLKLAAAAAVALAVLSLISLVASGSFLRQRALFSALERDNKQLRRANQRLSETIGQAQARLNQFEQRARSLAIAAGVADTLNPPADTLRGGVGSGGPLDTLGKDAQSILRREENLDQQFAKVEKSLVDKAIMLSHTPTVAPVVGVITDGFGPRIDPVTHQPAFHDGLDLSVAIGTVVHAPADGVVVTADRESGYGKILKISHGYGYTTVYGHLDRFLVKEGQKVVRGQPIGKVGMTGRTTGPHLHYEVWKDGERQNPLHYILDAY